MVNFRFYWILIGNKSVSDTLVLFKIIQEVFVSLLLKMAAHSMLWCGDSHLILKNKSKVTNFYKGAVITLYQWAKFEWLQKLDSNALR